MLAAPVVATLGAITVATTSKLATLRVLFIEMVGYTGALSQELCIHLSAYRSVSLLAVLCPCPFVTVNFGELRAPPLLTSPGQVLTVVATVRNGGGGDDDGGGGDRKKCGAGAGGSSIFQRTTWTSWIAGACAASVRRAGNGATRSLCGVS